VVEEAIVRVFREAGASEEDLRIVRNVLGLLREGRVSALEAYYALVGLARERLIPLTPRQVGDIREALGLPRSMWPP
jgi:hypothetical protein